MNYPVILVLLAVILQTRAQTICYHLGPHCMPQPSGGGGGGWLLAMMESRARAQTHEGEQRETSEMQEFACDCCCSLVPCAYSWSLCGKSIRYCSVGDCYAHILGK